MKKLVLLLLLGFLIHHLPTVVWALESSELLRYEVTWNGSKAGHGDISATKDSGKIVVTAQAVSDGVLKALVEVWSRIQATFHAGTFKPQSYKFHLKSSLGNPELVDLAFDHKTNLVQVNKRKGSELECHAEKFGSVYDPITAIYLLRYQKDLRKPMFVDIYDGKDRARLMVSPAGTEMVNVKAGQQPAIALNLRLVKLTGDKKEIGTGKLWVSDDSRRIPLLLTSSPLVGTIRFELVQAQL